MREGLFSYGTGDGSKKGGRRFFQALLYSGFYCYAYIFFNRLFFSPGDQTALHPIFIQVVLAVAAAVILLFPHTMSRRPVNAKIITIVATLFAAGILLGFLGISETVFAGLTTRLLGIILFCTAFVLYTVLWARVYERLDITTTLLSLAFSVFLSTIVRSLTYFDIYGSVVLGIVLTALLLSSLFMLYRRAGAPSESWAVPLSRNLPDQSLRDVVLGETKEPLIAAFAIAFGIGLMWGENSSFNYNSSFSVVAACLVTALVAFLVIRKSKSMFVHYVLYRVMFPLAALLLLASLFLISPSGSFATEQVFSFAYYLALSFFEVAIFASLVTIAQVNEVSSIRAIAAKFVVYGGGFLLGKLLLVLFGSGIANVALGFALISYVGVSIFLLARTLPTSAQDQGESMQDRVIREAELGYSLTPREIDVLRGLLQGRTYESVARTLFISSSTVKTHVKHIYSKVGVSTRDELIDFLTGHHLT